MATRSGPIGVVFRIVMAAPFVGMGLVADVAAARHHAAFGVVFGLVFAGAGVWQIVAALRDRRSLESRAPPIQANVALGGGAPDVPVPYRAAAPRGGTARDVYAPVLASAPLPKLATRAGRSLPVALGLAAPREAIVLLAFSIVWNVMVLPMFVGVLFVKVWYLSAFVSLFVLAGVVMLVSSVKKLLSRAKLPRVEISEEPVFLGDDLIVHVEQRGPAKILRLRVEIVCRERVTSGSGTSSRTERHDVWQSDLVDETGRRLGWGETWAHDARVTLPAQLPHSFLSGDNAIEWLLRVRADIAGWPDYDELYELRALPRPTR